MRYTRREFLSTATTAVGASLLPFGSLLAAGPGSGPGPKGSDPTARYRRHDVATVEGQRMLASYARGVQAMLALPAEHPHNWFRNAFTHFLDCPHGNWWFYVWHRGYVGYFERTIRKLSGDASFAMPFWDWTRHPEIPSGMFDGVLTPTDSAYAPYTGNLFKFTEFVKPAMLKYWNSLSSAQRAQLQTRGYPTFDDVWNDVTGYSVAHKAGLSGNQSYAITCGARYLSRSNPKLDAKTTYDVSPHIVSSGLMPTLFYDPSISNSFASSKTATHLVQPDGSTNFSILEGFPHNKVHNYIGGVGAIDPGPYGNMTNFLSPVDPIFYLHHSNMDRLWDLWTKKQLAAGQPILPTGDDLATFMNEPFLFYVDGEGGFVGPSKAGDYVSTSAFDYDYGPGFGSDMPIIPRIKSTSSANRYGAIKGNIEADAASVVLPSALVKRHLSDALPAPLIAEVTMDRPEGLAVTREFDVLVNAPAGVGRVDADSPYYAGTIAFFGPTMPNMAMSHSATFAVPLRKTLQAFSSSNAESAGTRLNIRLVPSGTQPADPVPVQAVSITSGG
ncbi:tyrosinase family protein [Lysobacter gummosus]|uniref:Tyrosinase family protein n=1 Tax=Lysobacter gummosus TaxID=262324 RepID=A0ABY3XII3_9GAMM|nr:tyrosinase family protein [Lysobacter gummosus]ALN91041.1 common central domain of tyrosinase family protein [Lysobacter gummosus]UNP31473.1 tyrosinase family protein [Lysobacter gummosus]